MIDTEPVFKLVGVFSPLDLDFVHRMMVIIMGHVYKGGTVQVIMGGQGK
jgi:hypothetical protein